MQQLGSDFATSPYSPLPTDEPHIRLAILAPGDFNDVVVVSLKIEAFINEDATEYEALSYAWGTELSPSKALVEGVAMPMTANLDCALCYIRQPDTHRILCVEALCIN